MSIAKDGEEAHITWWLFEEFYGSKIIKNPVQDLQNH
jgi:hypothetical protein